MKYGIRDQITKENFLEARSHLVREFDTPMHGRTVYFCGELSKKYIFLLEDLSVTEDLVEFVRKLVSKTRDSGCFLDLIGIQRYGYSEIRSTGHFYIPANNIDYALQEGIEEELKELNPNLGLLMDDTLLLSESLQWGIQHCYAQRYLLFAGTKLAAEAVDEISEDLFWSVEHFLEFYSQNGYRFSKNIKPDSSWIQRLMIYAYGFEKGFSLMEEAGLFQ